jgi:hypothetical protein
MTTTHAKGTAMWKLEFYDIVDAEESDPDVKWELFNDNLDDLEMELSKKLDVDISLHYFDTMLHPQNGIDSFMVNNVAGDALGIAYIGNEESFK